VNVGFREFDSLHLSKGRYQNAEQEQSYAAANTFEKFFVFDTKTLSWLPPIASENTPTVSKANMVTSVVAIGSEIWFSVWGELHRFNVKTRKYIEVSRTIINNADDLNSNQLKVTKMASKVALPSLCEPKVSESNNAQ